MTEITLKITLEELRQIDKYVELNDETQPLLNKIRDAYPEPHPLFDVIRNLGYSVDMCYEIVDAVEEFEKSKEVKKLQEKNWYVDTKTLLKSNCEPTPQEPEEENDKNFKNSLDLIKQWGEQNKPKTLYEILWNWWENIFTVDSDLDADASIDMLVSIIDEKFIPPYHDTNDYQWNKCLELMRNKLRNKE